MEMTRELEELADRLIALTPEDRDTLIKVVFGSGLPEVTDLDPSGTAADDDQNDEEVYEISGRRVDKRTFDLCERTTGIFSVEQFDLTPEEAAQAFEAQEVAQRYLRGSAHFFGKSKHEQVFELAHELRELGKFVGANASRDRWQIPTCEQIIEALARGGFRPKQPTAEENQ